ncbi:UBA domain-containing protein 3 [Lasiodiplodia hormozganensis]|uniref:UBA domain-containing protein 3 n=1 Tax=Lasiodiplodia hormozganensis TaxID=869390 RepID=A0AA39XNY0_9PEZI|nr:UBA domain-containing protein 3 [Lasiodiplodia hormozganensis]
MASALNKRQQARNERALQDLIKSVAGNDRCADCGARNPGWASWSLGIFLCMRCATLHRKLGTHISKVKSLSMDSWSNDQVDNMKRVGNVASNRIYNPNNVKPNIPIDVDEVEGALERFIRQKYEHKAFSGESRPGTRHNTGSTSSAEDRPPPLPPKPGKRFGFGLRASSATFPAPKPDSTSPPSSPSVGVGLSGFGDSSPPRVNKASRVFGHNVRSASADSFETKLQTLKDMGFPDEKRNVTVLKGLNGNLEKSVETLIRLGEGGRSISRAHTPVSAHSENANGLSTGRTRPSAPPPTAPAGIQSTNPFDRLDAPQPMIQQQFQALQAQPTGASFNPFLPSSQPPQAPATAHPALDQSFQNLQLSQPQQPQQLFPNHTGGHGTQSQQQQGYNPFLHTFTPPPVPQIPPQFTGTQQGQPSYGQQGGFHSTQGGNPFLKTSRSQIFTSSNPFNSQVPSLPAFSQPQQHQQQQQPQWQAISNPQGQFYPQPSQQTAQFGFGQQQQGPSTGYQQPQDQFQAQSGYPQFQQQPNHFTNPYQPQPQFPIRQDKNSILALYNQPQLAPAPPSGTTAPGAAESMPVNGQSAALPAASNSAGDMAGSTGSANPFSTAPGQPAVGANGGGGARHVSQESVDFSGMMGGRQSPDAFAGLSARFGR